MSPKSVWDGPPTLWDAFPGSGRLGTARDGAGSTPNNFLPRMFNLQNQVRAAAHVYSMWLGSKTWAAIGGPFNDSVQKTILARLAAILAILLCFSARGTKINSIEKKNNEKHTF